MKIYLKPEVGREAVRPRHPKERTLLTTGTTVIKSVTGLKNEELGGKWVAKQPAGCSNHFKQYTLF